VSLLDTSTNSSSRRPAALTSVTPHGRVYNNKQWILATKDKAF